MFKNFCPPETYNLLGEIKHVTNLKYKQQFTEKKKKNTLVMVNNDSTESRISTEVKGWIIF